MNHSDHPPSLLGRFLDRGHVWGRVDVVPAARAVWMHTRLTVYPPGTNHLERRLLRLHRDWPVAAAVIALFGMIAVAPVVGIWGAAGIAVALYVGGIAATSRLARDLRQRCARLDCVATMSGGGYVVHGDQRLLEEARHDLVALESHLNRGEISPVEFEAGWARVYQLVASHSDAPLRKR